MECLLQYWDELDDLYWIVAALRERARRLVVAVAFLSGLFAVACAGAFAAMLAPSLALTAATMLSLALLGRPVASLVRGVRAPG